MRINVEVAWISEATVRCLLVVIATVLLASCAGRHAVPAPNYSAADTRDPPTVRIAFDQNGNIFPRAGNREGLSWPSNLRRSSGAFSIKTYFADRGQLALYDQTSIRREVAATIAGSLARRPAARLVILIHGFNNSYLEASESFDLVQRLLAADPGEEVILQVFWDGLQDPPLSVLPFWYWPDSMTYSNRAGQCGLRDLVRLLPAGTDVSFITHSRGAAVALSVLANPTYDTGIGGCASVPPVPTQLRDVRLAFFAPAIGDGHVLQGGRRSLEAYPQVTGLVVGFNPKDPATAKRKFGIDISERRMGDTRLASNDLYYRELEKGAGLRVQRETFDQPNHAWGAYLGADPDSAANLARAKCMLWAAYAIVQKPDACSLRR